VVDRPGRHRVRPVAPDWAREANGSCKAAGRAGRSQRRTAHTVASSVRGSPRRCDPPAIRSRPCCKSPRVWMSASPNRAPRSTARPASLVDVASMLSHKTSLTRPGIRTRNLADHHSRCVASGRPRCGDRELPLERALLGLYRQIWLGSEPGRLGERLKSVAPNRPSRSARAGRLALSVILSWL
jgi:hypothetical protein